MFAFAPARARRKPSLTPMIDVVFLLLVFFMLAAQFGQDVALPISTAGGTHDYSGPPRLITISRDKVMLNGIPVPLTALATALQQLVKTRDDTIVLRPQGGATVQRLTDVTDILSNAGFSRLVLVE